MKFHLYKRNVKGKTKWYYWYYDENHKQVRKSCGNCSLKREAEAYIEQLLVQDQEADNKKIKIKDFVTEMYKDNSDYLLRKKQHGKELNSCTLSIQKTVIKPFVKEFGEYYPDQITSEILEDFLVHSQYSNSYKNQLLWEINIIMNECVRAGLIQSVPKVEKFVSEKSKKDTLTINELKKLFPADYNELIKVWKMPKTNKLFVGQDNEIHDYSLMWGIIFKLIVCTGLRSGEVRAITEDQIKENGIIINKKLNVKQKIDPWLKKGNSQNLKNRVVLIPDFLEKDLKYWISIRPRTKFIFSESDKPICTGVISYHLRVGLYNIGLMDHYKKRNNITIDGREITTHSLRYTYNSLMVTQGFDLQALRLLMGHTSESMTNYYYKPSLEDQLDTMQKYKNKINEIWTSNIDN